MQLTKVKCPDYQIGTKCPYTMTPTRIVVHNTANDASAMAEISYMLGNSNEVSFHYAVDDYRVVQGIEENRNAWHAGDGGNGKGNREGIAIEICYSKSGGDRFIKAEQNAVELIVDILKRYGWGIDKVTKHQDYSGKYCPQRTLDMGWDRFIKMVEARLNPTPKPEPQKFKYNIGDKVVLNGHLYKTANGEGQGKLKENCICKITLRHEGIKPYNVDTGTGYNDGWVAEYNLTPYAEPKKEIAIGTKVRTIGLGKENSYGTGRNAKKGLVGTITNIKEGRPYPYLVNQDGWYKKEDLEIL